MKFKITESIEDKGILKAIFMAGSPGAGKSYTLSQISAGTISPRIVNTDKFTEYFQEGDIRDIVDTSKMLTGKQLYLYINSMLPLFVDSTSTQSKNIIKRSGILQSIGYDTGMIFVNTPLETALTRVKKRNESMPEHRKVSLDWAREAHERVMAAKKFYQSRFPFFYEIRNDDGELTDEVILKAYRKVKGFFEEPLDNPEGIRDVKVMRQSGWKYFTDGMITEEYLKKLISIWYI